MNKIDFLNLDVRSLRTFLIVLEELSISKAAERLNVTQSAVSHTLSKLRIAMGDPLFVRSGRHISATERATALREPIQNVLDELKGLTDQRSFDPTTRELEYVIAANDFQRDLIFPNLLQNLDKDITIHTQFIASGLPAAKLLRQDRCQLLITPYPPDGPDIYQIRLFEDHLVCFYDDAMRNAPKNLEEFLTSDLIDIKFEDNKSTSTALNFSIKDQLKKAKVTVSNFNAVYLFLKNSEMLCVGVSLMSKLGYHGLQQSELPFKSPSIPMYLVWHRRNHSDPANLWLRNKIKDFVKENIKN